MMLLVSAWMDDCVLISLATIAVLSVPQSVKGSLDKHFSSTPCLHLPGFTILHKLGNFHLNSDLEGFNLGREKPSKNMMNAD
jgi:hypothetical protein